MSYELFDVFAAHVHCFIVFCTHKLLISQTRCLLCSIPVIYRILTHPRPWIGDHHSARLILPSLVNAVLYSLCIHKIGLRICVHNFLSDFVTACSKSRQKTHVTTIQLNISTKHYPVSVFI